MKLPEFIIIGAAKSGTTSLFKYFEEDKSIFLCEPKEPEFFARDDKYSKGLSWYSNLFSNAKHGQICCEASTFYSLSPLFPDAAKRMHSVLPSAKLVYIMRDPVKRAYSYYVQLMKNYQNSYKSTNVPISFEDFLFQKNNYIGENNCPYLASFDDHLIFGPELLTAGGMYLDQINEYLKYYDSSSMYFMIFEEFIANPLEELRKLYLFLGISSEFISENFSEVRENISGDHFKSLATVSCIEKIKKVPFVSKAINVLPKQISSKGRRLVNSFIIKKGIDKNYIPEKMSSKAKNHLTKLYMKPTVQLSEFLDRDLVNFWSMR